MTIEEHVVKIKRGVERDGQASAAAVLANAVRDMLSIHDKDEVELFVTHLGTSWRVALLRSLRGDD